MGEGEHRDAQRRRREFIRAHHPDLGGDPEAFIAGLRSFDAIEASHQPSGGELPQVVVVRQRPLPVRLLVRLVRLVRLGPGQRRRPRVR